MNLAQIGHRAQRIVSNNSPAILTAIAVTGTITTAVLTGKATFKYTKLLAEEGYYDPDYTFERSTKEHVEKAWKLYLPSIGAGVLTIACVILSSRIATKRTAALAATLAIAEKGFDEYRAKILQKIGGTKEQAARDEIAQDRVKNNPPTSANTTIVVGGKDVLCFDKYTGRYFNSDIETLKQAQNRLNHQVLNDYYASLSDFYSFIGLPPTSFSDDVGWNSDKMMELEFSTVLSEDSRPCIAMGFAVVPIRNFSRIN
jgi:Family of unknown function (DUF6353)